MICNNGISEQFYIQKAFEYSQTEGEKTEEGMRLFIGADAEKFEELKENEAIKNLIAFIK